MGATAESALSVCDLRTESRPEPLGLDARRPRLSWKLTSDERGQRQTAYRIRVHRLSFLEPGRNALVWDSDWQQDDRVHAFYEGEPLEASTRYEWSVTVRASAGPDRASETVTSETTWFETALLESAAGAAGWIRRDPFKNTPVVPPHDAESSVSGYSIPPAVYLRHEFTVPERIVRARAYVTARGLYRLYANGHRVGDHELAPGWTDYRHHVQYQTYDVTDVLRPGSNGVGIVLADGWWSGYVGFDRRHQAHHYGTAPEAWLRLLVDTADGAQHVVTTSPDWLESEGPIRSADLLMGETVDARAALGDWTVAGFDASQWTPVRATDHAEVALVAMRGEPIRVTESVPPVAISMGERGQIVDFGQNISGRITLRVRGMRRGERIRVRHAEALDGRGELYTDNLRSAAATDEFISAGEDTVFAPAFTVHGFRYAEISGLDTEISRDDIRAEVLHNDLGWAGSFECDRDDVNVLAANIRWGLRGNFVGVPTDCPQRDERLGWLADAQVFFRTAAYNADVSSFFASWLADVRYTQSPEGAFPDIAPRLESMIRDGAPGWGDGGVIIPWQMYRFYGDDRILRDSFDSMAGWVDFIHENNPSLVWRRRVGNDYGDWLEVGADTPRDVLATAYFAHSTDLVARAARILGLESRAGEYEELAADIKRAFRASFVDEELRITGDSQTCYLLALSFDLFDDAERSLLADHLVRTVEEQNVHLTTGFIGVSMLCPVLCDIGRADLAYRLVLNDDFPSWLYPIRQGATTIWERWDGYTEADGFQSAEMNSFNHYSLGSVGEWLYQYVAGIGQAADSAGFERIEISPHIEAGLNRVRATYETPRGRVTSAWCRTDSGGLRIDVTIPPGAPARVTLPRPPDTHLLEGGVSVLQNPHISQVDTGDDSVRITAESGSYRFDLTTIIIST